MHDTVGATRADVQADLFEGIEVFHDRSRRHFTLGYSSPARFLENGVSQHVEQKSKGRAREALWKAKFDGHLTAPARPGTARHAGFTCAI